MTFINWCFKAHRDTNHLYDGYLPYEFHLKMAIQVAWDFKELLSEEDFKTHLLAIAGHDLIEDTRKSYNDIFQQLVSGDEMYITQVAKKVTEMIFAVSNETGRNRKERANTHYYWKIRDTPGAKFVKMCDKIANVRYSVYHGGMLGMHKSEHDYFLEQMQLEPVYKPMLDELDVLLSK